MRFKTGVLLLLAVFLTSGMGWAASEAEARATVVVYNSADPSSVDLAKYYAKRREIPAGNLVGLSCPRTPEISRAEFEQTIAEPLRDTFVERGWWRVRDGEVLTTKIRFVALMRGMPLKIRSAGLDAVPRTDQPDAVARRDEAAVGSELACLGLGAGKLPASGLVSNPYFRRYTPILQALTDPGLLLVCRLDAPTELTVRAMIDDAIMVERDGLWGWAYVDSRNIQSGGYAEGDAWMKTVATKMRSEGIPVLWDKAPPTLPAGYPVTDAALYFGWYAGSVNGPFDDLAFRFRPGAVAVHIHSFSAATLNNPQRGWCGPLLARGAAATLGNVYEPYLSLTAHLDIFQDRLTAGFTFAESAYMAMPALSWMGVAVGDPLYRPYASWQRFGEDKGRLSSWEKYRQIILAANGDILAAASELAEAAAATGKSMFLESLAAAQADAGKEAAALQTVNKALAMQNEPMVRFRLVLEKIGLLRATGKKSEAGSLVFTEMAKAPGPAQKKLLAVIQQQIFPPTPTPASASAGEKTP